MSELLLGIRGSDVLETLGDLERLDFDLPDFSLGLRVFLLGAESLRVDASGLEGLHLQVFVEHFHLVDGSSENVWIG